MDSRTLVINVCDLTDRDRLISVAVKAMHTDSSHNALPDSLLSDV